jgi:transposase
MRSGYLSKELCERAHLELKKYKKHAFIARKLEAIIAAYEHGITAVAKIYGVTRNTLRSWAKNFGLFQIDGLKAPENRHRKSILGAPEREFIKNTLEKDSQVTLKFLVEVVFEKYGKRVSKTTMHTEVKMLKYSYVTPRPQHYKQDKEKVETFKKTST